MGEIADMMLDGTLCEGCGVYMGDSGGGFTRRCASCAAPEGPHPQAQKVSCPKCQKRVKAIGLKDHMRDRHGVTQ